MKATLELEEFVANLTKWFGEAKRGRGAIGKIPVFGILKRGDKVYTQIVKRCSIKELLPIIQEKTTPDTVIYSDGFRAYDGLVNYGYKEHFRVNHSDNEFAIGHNHINGIELRSNREYL